MARSSRVPDPDDPDYVRIKVAFDWGDDALAAALRLPEAVEVVEPAWLRRALVDTAESILARYSERSAVARPG
jgi:hypothetical protein